ncbi:hypothetical protein E4T48_00710 [Aureobasidium sp. EXF-10727]|nr:hypothetical protein E4T48_00710 [Aureobasidium sp. EXF-10727]
MAHAAKLGALTDDLISAITPSTSRRDARQLRHLKDSALRTFKTQHHVRVNQFEIDAKLEGLLEKFYVLNNEPLADALKPRLDELAAIPNKWRPEVLALLLALSDRPAEKTNIDKALEIVPDEPVEQQLTWAEIIADDPLDEEGIWDDVEYESDYSEHRAPSLSDESIGEPTTSTSASSLDQQDLASLARAFVIPKDHELLDQVKDLRDRMTSTHSGSELTELQVIRQVLLMLHGLPTDLFELGANGRVRTRHSCRIANIAPSTLDRVLQEIALLGSQITVVRRFVASNQQSVVLQSFQAAVQIQLSELGRTLSGIEQDFLQQDSSTVASLLNVHAEVDRVARPLVRLGSLIPDDAHKHNVRALRLLENLFEQACNLQLIGQDEESIKVADLLFKCLEPYLRPVRLWMTEGKLIASNELFFVRSDDESSERGSIWHSRFKLLKQADGSVFAPGFMKSLAERIFKAGKSVMLLETLGHKPDVQQRSQQSLDLARIMQSVDNALLPFSETFKLALNRFADALEGSETKLLRQILMSQCGLQRTIIAVNHVYFGVNGAHFQNFAYGIFHRIDRGSGWDDRFLLTELAQTAFEPISAVMSDHITVRVKPRNDQESISTHGRRADMLGRIVIEYSNVLTQATLAVCQEAFTILLRLYRAQFLLNQHEWTLSIMASHSKEQRVKELLALRQHLSWFATTWKGYVCEVLSVVSAQLKIDLEAAADVDGMVAAFHTFQLNLTSKLLLHENLAPIQGSILAILELYEDLALEWRDAVKHICNSAPQPTPRQLVIQQSFSARRDRPEVDETADLTEDEDDSESHRQHDQSRATLKQQIRHQSTKPPAEALNQSRISRLEARLPRFLARYVKPLRNAPISHITAFLVLHELTAIVPLFGLTFAFHKFDWLPPVFSEGYWVKEGVEKFGRYFRRKGWIRDADGEGFEDEKNRKGFAKWWPRGEDGSCNRICDYKSAAAIAIGIESLAYTKLCKDIDSADQGPTFTISSLRASLHPLQSYTLLSRRESKSKMASPQIKRCASGSCFKDGTLHCAKCKVTFYCSKTCQKDHWTKHKKHCTPYKPMPKGTFDFLKLNRDTRDKIYEDLLVARYTPDQQAEHDSLTNATGDRFHIRNSLDKIKGRLEISPGTPLWGVKGYQPLVHVRGLLNVNKQINDELTSTFFSKNTFLIPVGEHFRYAITGQLFSYKLDTASLAQIKHLVVSVGAHFDIKHPRHGDGVAALKHNFKHIVKSLDVLGNKLESLTIRFISCFHGRVEEMRAQIDALLTEPSARPVQVMREDGSVRFYTSAFDLADAFETLHAPVKTFEIYGDVPAQVIKRLNRKFGVGGQDSKDSDSTSSAFVPTTIASRPGNHDTTGQHRKTLAELVKGMAAKHPNDKKMAAFAEKIAGMPLRSREVNAMLTGPPTPEEMEMLRRQTDK